MPETRALIGSTYEFQPEASDPDGDQLTFSAASLPTWAKLDPVTGQVSGQPGPGDAGPHGPITLSVSDGVSTVALAPFAVQVDATGVPPPKGITVSWQPASRNTDGTTLGGPARYRIYMGRASRVAEPPVLLTETAATRYRIRDLQPGTYYVALTSLSREGVESDFSEEMVARLN